MASIGVGFSGKCKFPCWSCLQLKSCGAEQWTAATTLSLKSESQLVPPSPIDCMTGLRHLQPEQWRCTAEMSVIVHAKQLRAQSCHETHNRGHSPHATGVKGNKTWSCDASAQQTAGAVLRCDVCRSNHCSWVLHQPSITELQSHDRRTACHQVRRCKLGGW